MKKLEKILEKIYIELYANATPMADFKQLVSDAPIIDGKKHIDYMAYEIDEDLANSIIENNIKKLSEWDKKSIRFNAYLGCAPKTN